MANRLTATELNNMWLLGTVYDYQGNMLGKDEMVKSYNSGNKIEIHTGDDVIEITPPTPRWLIAAGFATLPLFVYGLDYAFRVAGY